MDESDVSELSAEEREHLATFLRMLVDVLADDAENFVGYVSETRARWAAEGNVWADRLEHPGRAKRVA